jgi:putative membrane protein
MKIIINLFIRTLAILITTYLVPGVEVDNWLTAIVLVVILGLLNTVVKPILVILTLPINLLTLGLFTFVINIVIVLLASKLVLGFTVNSLFSGLLFSIVLSLVNSFLSSLRK